MFAKTAGKLTIPQGFSDGSGFDRDYLDRLNQGRTPGTGQWLLDDDRFTEWESSRNSRLWLSGHPGCGKTMLSAMVADHLLTSSKNESAAGSVGVAHFFFRSNSSSRHSFDGFLKSVVAQLFSAHPQPNVPERLFEDEASLRSTDSLVTALRAIIAQHDMVYIVVDGLDECEADSLPYFFHVLESLRIDGQGEDTDCRIMVSSRQSQDISQGMESLLFRRIPLEESAVASDITMMMDSELNTMRNLRHLPLAFKREVRTKLLQTPIRTFAHVRLLLDTIRRQSTRDILFPMRQDEFYRMKQHYIFLSFLFDCILDDEVPLAKRFFSWMAFHESGAPLSMIEVFEVALSSGSTPMGILDAFNQPSLHALSSQRGGSIMSLMDILRVLGTPEEEVAPIRSILREFLLSTASGKIRMREKETQAYLATSCLEYIIHYAESSERRRTSRDLTTFPLLEYACRHWQTHSQKYAALAAADQEAPGQRCLADLATQLLSNGHLLECWLSVHDPNNPSGPAFTSRAGSNPPKRDTPLIHAVRIGSLKTVKYFLGPGAGACTKDIHGTSVLSLAAKGPFVDIVRELLSQGATTSVDDLLDAAKSDHVGLTRVFAQHMGRERICEIGTDNTTILHSLTACATEQTFQVLLEEVDEGGQSRNIPNSATPPSNSSVNLTDGARWSLLHRAVEAGNTSVVWMLIQHGANINIRGNGKNTPLHTCYTVDGDRDAIQELLLGSGADVRLRNKDNKTPLQIAWQKKALQWDCYEVDSGHAAGKEFTPGTQAECSVLKKLKPFPGPDMIFRKTYELHKMNRGDAGEVYEVLLRECENLQRIEHPFVVSYLGYDEELAENSADKLPCRAKLYLEYCGGRDLGLAHMEQAICKPRPRRNSTDDDDDDDDEEEKDDKKSKKKENSKAQTRVVALTESEVWTLMYQLFLALAYLHYGIQVTKDGECRCVPHWKGMIHRDIKPNNVVLALDKNNQRVAKLCDLGISRANSPHQTKAILRGSHGFQPHELWPESGDESGEAESNWTTKGDIWCLGRTIDKLKKNFNPSGKMKEILYNCGQKDKTTRPSALEVVQEVHSHVEKPFESLDRKLGQGPGGFMFQAFQKIATGLDEYTNLQAASQSKAAARPRRLLLERLNLLLEDGAEKPFLQHSRSLHHAVLLDKGDKLTALLQDNCDPDEQWPKSRWTPLHLAVQQKRFGMVEELVLAGAKDLRDRHGCTAWDYARVMGREFADQCFTRKQKAEQKLRDAMEAKVVSEES